MKPRDALALGAVQGLTEFLPVSSSAHLLLARRLLAHHDLPLAFDVALHAASAGSLLTAAGSDLLAPFRSLLRDAERHRLSLGDYRAQSRLALRLIAANAPAVILGAALGERIEARARGPRRVAATLALGSVILAAAGRLERRQHPRALTDLRTHEAMLIGMAQAAALLPGVSRSGATIAAGLALGLDREQAVRFSFLLAAPITLAAAVRTLPRGVALARLVGVAPLAVGVAASYLTGLLGIGLLRRVVMSAGLRPFLLYRLALAAAVLLSVGEPGGERRAAWKWW